MGVAYRAVTWNRQKRIYDSVIAAGVVSYLGAFLALSFALRPGITFETALIRALGSGALLLLHVVLSIGPLSRLNPKFLPLLYNRRHLGVTMFFLALGHGAFSILQFHSLGSINPLLSVFVSNPNYLSISQFPFQPLGLIALLILFLMAATSHDFWLANLTPPVWKALHMGVYLAYGLIVMHVVLGVLQSETSPLLAAALALGVVWVVGLHLAAAGRETGADRELRASGDEAGYLEVCAVGDIPEDRAKIICLSGERVAVFRYQGKVSAVSNVCQHQNGPLGEGRIVDGCITCPWHGYQYLPDSGASPPPFEEKIPTFNVRVRQGKVWVHPRPNPPGTRVEPADAAG